MRSWTSASFFSLFVNAGLPSGESFTSGLEIVPSGFVIVPSGFVVASSGFGVASGVALGLVVLSVFGVPVVGAVSVFGFVFRT